MAAKPAQEVSTPYVVPLVINSSYTLFSCRVTTGHSFRLSNSLLKLPQIAFQKRENIFILRSDYISGFGSAEKAAQGTFTLVFLSWPAPYLTVEIKNSTKQHTEVA